MATEPQPARSSRVLFWLGWVVSILPSLMLLMSGVMKLSGSEEVEKGFNHLGWPYELALTLAIVEITCTILYLLPPTAVLGAILVTGYLGGAIATHVRLHEGFAPAVVLGIFVWGGLWLRDPRVRTLLPWRRKA